MSQKFNPDICCAIVDNLLDKSFTSYFYNLPEFQFTITKKCRLTGFMEVYKLNLIDCIKDLVLTYYKYKKEGEGLGRNEKQRIRNKTLLVQKGLVHFKKVISKRN